jgi:hypothetical protein
MSKQVALIFPLQMRVGHSAKHLLFASPALAKAMSNFATAP